MHQTVDKYEAGSEHPVKLEALSEKTMGLLNGVVGIKIEVSELRAQFKLSQNKDAADQVRIREQLQARGDCMSQQIAEAMQQNERAGPENG